MIHSLFASEARALAASQEHHQARARRTRITRPQPRREPCRRSRSGSPANWCRRSARLPGTRRRRGCRCRPVAALRPPRRRRGRRSPRRRGRRCRADCRGRSPRRTAARRRTGPVPAPSCAVVEAASAGRWCPVGLVGAPAIAVRAPRRPLPPITFFVVPEQGGELPWPEAGGPRRRRRRRFTLPRAGSGVADRPTAMWSVDTLDRRIHHSGKVAQSVPDRVKPRRHRAHARHPPHNGRGRTEILNGLKDAGYDSSPSVSCDLVRWRSAERAPCLRSVTCSNRFWAGVIGSAHLLGAATH